MNAPLELIDQIDDNRAPPAAPPPYQLTAVDHAIRSGATPEQMVAAMQLQVQMDNHRLELMREQRRYVAHDLVEGSAAVPVRPKRVVRTR